MARVVLADGRGNMNEDIAFEIVQDGMLTIEKACEWLGLSRAKVYQLMDRGELPYVKIGRARRIPKRALVEFAAANLRGGWSMDLRGLGARL